MYLYDASHCSLENKGFALGVEGGEGECELIFLCWKDHSLLVPSPSSSLGQLVCAKCFSSSCSCSCSLPLMKVEGCRNLPVDRRARRKAKEHPQKRKMRGSRHQRLFQENVTKTKKKKVYVF